jgi:hypothetical protein
MARTVTNVVLGLFMVAGVLSPLACSGNDAVVSDDPSASQDQSLLKEGACIGDSIGGPTSCKPAEVWKQYAADSCKMRGLDLTDISLGGTCKGGYVEAKFSCCKPGPVPVPPPVPGPTCFGDAQGGPTSCKPAEVWKQYASNACALKKSQLVAIDYAEECAKGSFRWTKYECCDGTKPPPPPPPPACKTDILGDKTSCKPDGTWKEYAFNHCVEQKLSFADMSLGPSCGKDMSTSVKVTCCGATPPPPPPPPPPPVCEWRSQGGPTSCKDPGTWKQYSFDACKADGLTLGELSFPDAKCGPGGATAEVKFTCCK